MHVRAHSPRSAIKVHAYLRPQDALQLHITPLGLDAERALEHLAPLANGLRAARGAVVPKVLPVAHHAALQLKYLRGRFAVRVRPAWTAAGQTWSGE